MFRPSIILASFLALLAGLSSSASALDFDVVTAVRDRTISSQVLLTVNLKSVTPTDNSALGISAIESARIQQAMANFLDICLTPATSTQSSCGETDIKVKYQIGRLPAPQPESFTSQTQVANFNSNGTTIVEDPKVPQIRSYKIEILIKDSGEIAVGSKILLRLFPEKASANGNKDKIDTLVKLGSGVKDAVKTTGAFSTPKTIAATWENLPQVTFVDNSTGSANGIIGILIPHANILASAVFPAKVFVANPFDPATPDNQTATCTIATNTVDPNNETCSVSCNQTSTTFDIEAFTSQGIRSSTTDITKNSIGFDNVNIDDGPYAIVLQYLPEGTAYSCVLSTPADAATLVQLQGGPAPKAGDPSCFIATAAYGSALDPHIDVLRWFRDRYLLKSRLGRQFVRSYYRNSPPLADWIAAHSWAKAATRAALWAPVLFLELLRDHKEILVAACLLLFAFVAMRRRLASF